MKDKTKNKIKKSSIMLFSFSCLALMGTTLAIDRQNNVKQENLVVNKAEEKQKLKKLPKRNTPAQQQNWTITNTSFTKDQVYNAWSTISGETWANFSTQEERYTVTDTTNNVTTFIFGYDGGIYITLYNIDVQWDLIDENSQLTSTDTNNKLPITLTSYPQELYNAFYPPQPGMGEQIIDSVESGLGMIGTLATNFLAGFSALFWNATNAELTSFGIFSLVFLGIAITFSIIKLILNLIRSNTGV